MSKADLDKMKAFLAEKKAKQKDSQKYDSHNQTGSSIKHQSGKQKNKTQGSNNKV